jgi:hypothetical protein
LPIVVLEDFFKPIILEVIGMMLLKEPFMRRILLLSLVVPLISISCFAQLGDILKSAEGAVETS